MRKTLPILLVLITLGIVVFFGLSKSPTAKKFYPSPSPYPTLSPTNGDYTVTLSPAVSRNIEVLSPREGEEVKSGFAVKGNARVFENVVSIRLLDSVGNVLAQTTAYANSPDAGKFGPFEKMIEFSTFDNRGVLEVYQASPKDGSDIDKVRVNVKFIK